MSSIFLEELEMFLNGINDEGLFDLYFILEDYYDDNGLEELHYEYFWVKYNNPRPRDMREESNENIIIVMRE